MLAVLHFLACMGAPGAACSPFLTLSRRAQPVSVVRLLVSACQQPAAMPKVKKGQQEDDILQEAAPTAAIEAGVEGVEDMQAEGAAVKPKFPPLSAFDQNGRRIEFRRVPVPQNRLTPLKNNWLALYKPVTENLKLDMRMNLKTRKVRAGRAAQSLWHCTGVGTGAWGGLRAPTRRGVQRAAGVACNRRLRWHPAGQLKWVLTPPPHMLRRWRSRRRRRQRTWATCSGQQTLCTPSY